MMKHDKICDLLIDSTLSKFEKRKLVELINL